MGIEGYKTIGWRAASKYTKREVFILAGENEKKGGDMLEVKVVEKRGPNIRITLTDGRIIESRRERLFYTRTGGARRIKANG